MSAPRIEKKVLWGNLNLTFEEYRCEKRSLECRLPIDECRIVESLRSILIKIDRR